MGRNVSWGSDETDRGWKGGKGIWSNNDEIGS